jgi:hypothetical protein
MHIYAFIDKCGSVASDAEKLAKPIMRATCACICMCACERVWARARVCVSMRACVPVCLCMCARACVCVCARACVCVCTPVYTRALL